MPKFLNPCKKDFLHGRQFLDMIKIFKAGVLECWSIVEDPVFFRGNIETIVLKFQKVLLGPSLQYSITPIINNVLWTTDDPIDKEMQFKG